MQVVAVQSIVLFSLQMVSGIILP